MHNPTIEVLPTISVNTSFPASRHWHASLSLTLELMGVKTVLSKVEHSGPLRIQKPFTQSDGSCHVYILHPPGGVVGGDKLRIKIEAGPETSAMFTTPSAGKFYRCDSTQPGQSQTLQLEVGEGAHLEWVPQETIFYDNARASISSTVALDTKATYLGWEVQCLGRLASGDTFKNGSVSQALKVMVGGDLVHRERFVVSNEYDRCSPVHLHRSPIVGTLLAVVRTDLKTDITKQLVTALVAEKNEPEWGVSRKGRLILVRYLGGSAEACRTGFESARNILIAAGVFNSTARALRPRIWNT